MLMDAETARQTLGVNKDTPWNNVREQFRQSAKRASVVSDAALIAVTNAFNFLKARRNVQTVINQIQANFGVVIAFTMQQQGLSFNNIRFASRADIIRFQDRSYDVFVEFNSSGTKGALDQLCAQWHEAGLTLEIFLDDQDQEVGIAINWGGFDSATGRYRRETEISNALRELEPS